MKQTATNKKSFILYDDFYEQLKDLTPEQAGHYLKSIYAYRHNDEYQCDDTLVKFALKGTISQLKRDEEKYKNKCEKNKENISKRWESRGNKKIRSNTNVYEKVRTNTNHTDSDSDSDSDSDNDTVNNTSKEKPPAVARRIMLFYNENRGSMAECQALSAKRISAINLRIKEHGEDAVKDVVIKASCSDFLQGKTDACFSCGIDWIFNPSNFLKILEGNYENKSSSKPQSQEYLLPEV